ncbi:MAG: DEAD/DEAH box helicase [Candidatus Symbiobacter sp.]|nr:DEAD/DEAH box helicase [Candidatus Symbiobacter sp.]
MDFFQLGLSPEVVNSVTEAGYETPTPIQSQAIPSVLAGRDVLATAQTGTGKTASFVLPMIDILAEGRSRARMPRALILEPTRELATQVSENFDKYGKYSHLTMALIIGGVSMGDQEKLLDRGVDVLIATPGRLLDHFERGRILLTDAKILVIDEADRMLDMGFIPDIEKLVSILPPRGRQTLLFSATMSPEIKLLADKFLNNPKEITVSKPATTASTVAQHLIITHERQKREALRALLRAEAVKNAIIFCNRKITVTTLLQSLRRHGFSVAALHGDMPQSSRTTTLESFRNNEITLLVASDVAARGLDISDLSHVINFDVPINAEDYVHRIGRTGRAGRLGRAFTFATPKNEREVTAIESLIGQKIPRYVPEGGIEMGFDEASDATTQTTSPARPGASRSGTPRQGSSPEAGESGRQPRRSPPNLRGRGRNRAAAAVPAPVDDAAPYPIDQPQPPPAHDAIQTVTQNVIPVTESPQSWLPLEEARPVPAAAAPPPAPIIETNAERPWSRQRGNPQEGREGRGRNRDQARDGGDRTARPERDGRDNPRGSGRGSNRNNSQNSEQPENPGEFIYGAADSPFGEFGPVPAFLLHRVKLASLDGLGDEGNGE